MHYHKFIKLFGPIYGWWLFAFERFNGMLEKVKLNGHDGGRMELTLMRHWVMTHLLYEYLLALPDDAEYDEERAYIDQVIRQEGQETHGGMMTELAMYQAEASIGNNITLPHRLGKLVNVADILPDGTAYSLMLQYLRELWPDLNVVDDASLQGGMPFYRSKSIRTISYVQKDGIHYGSATNKCTDADSVVFISGGPDCRIPAEIIAILSVKLEEKPPHVCTLVRQMYGDDDIPSFPWDL